ncbi:SRPBCC family protein [Amycolatopsis sp. NPDC051106]|uniref:SRPBCC family protein n=1 Tax=unclassified Amycolatopsis TaxID=2618356 RepID=UPI0034440D2A
MTEPVLALDPASFAFTRRVWVPAAPQVVYDLVSDVAKIELWSPTASRVRYDEGDGPTPGAWFGGHNRRGEREWASRSQVLTAEAPTEFAFVVGGLDDGIVRWRWLITGDGPGSVVTQTWDLVRMDPVLGSDAREVTELRNEMAASAEQTLLALSRWLHEHRLKGTFSAPVADSPSGS